MCGIRWLNCNVAWTNLLVTLYRESAGSPRTSDWHAAFDASVVGRARFHRNVQEDQEDKSGIAIAVARPFAEEHPAVHAVEHASEYVEGYEYDPHEYQERGQDHDEESG